MLAWLQARRIGGVMASDMEKQGIGADWRSLDVRQKRGGLTRLGGLAPAAASRQHRWVLTFT
jgi:hypothetical protein